MPDRSTFNPKVAGSIPARPIEKGPASGFTSGEVPGVGHVRRDQDVTRTGSLSRSSSTPVP